MSPTPTIEASIHLTGRLTVSSLDSLAARAAMGCRFRADIGPHLRGLREQSERREGHSALPASRRELQASRRQASIGRLLLLVFAPVRPALALEEGLSIASRHRENLRAPHDTE